MKPGLTLVLCTATLPLLYRASATPAAAPAPRASPPTQAIGVSQTLGVVPPGFMILGRTETSPSGYTFTGDAISTQSGGVPTWIDGETMLTNREGAASVEVNGKIYVIGGHNGSHLNTVEEYDPAKDLWTRKADMPTPRGALAAVALSGLIYAIGGENGTGALKTVERYDPAQDSWASGPDDPSDLQLQRCFLGAAAVGGKIYAAGGRIVSGSNSQTATVEQYDPLADDWDYVASLPVAWSHMGAAAAHGRMYVMGGWDGFVTGAWTWEYDPEANEWRARTSMPTPRHSLAGTAANGRIYALGGWNQGSTQAFEEYDPLEDVWRSPVAMPRARSGIAAAAWNGKLYAIGGYDGAWSNDVQVHDTGTRTLYVHERD